MRRPTVFEEVCRVFLGVLKTGEGTNLKVKHIALYKLFPKLVNISVPFIEGKHSELFMRILVRGCKIEWGNDATKMKHFMPHLKLASDFVRNGGLVFTVGVLEGTDQIANFKRVLLSFQRCYINTDEKMKREILRVMLEWLVQLNS